MTAMLDDKQPALEDEIADLKRELESCRAELEEAREQQTATAEVLEVINSSPGDLAPVFDAILERALRACNASFGQLVTFDGIGFRAAGWRGFQPRSGRSAHGTAPEPGMALYRLVHGEDIVHIPDITADEVYRSGNAERRRLADQFGGRTAIWAALRKSGTLLGAFVIYRKEVRPFTDGEIALLQSFAAQAVIAIENARLLTETREALEAQTATAEVLQVINSSPGNLAPVFQAMLHKAHTLCEASFGALMTYDGERFHPVVHHGTPAPFREFLAPGLRPGMGDPFARMVEGAVFSHIHDLAEVAERYREAPLPRAAVDLGGVRSFLAVPLRKDNALLGVITAYRLEVRPFTDKQIALLQNFAAQAVIAMESARLLGELRERTSDLEEALEYQTAISDVLKVISQSGSELGAVLDTLVATAARICEAESGFIFRLQDGFLRMIASFGVPAEYREFQMRNPIAPGRGTLAGRIALAQRAVEIADAATDPEYTRAEAVKLGLQRTMVGAPLTREDTLIGAITLARTRVDPFTTKQIELVTTFADQAVIAIENARLLGELRERTEDLQESLEYQTAISDVLKVINQSTFDLRPVLENVIETALRLCRAKMGSIFRLNQGVYRWAVGRGLEPAYEEIERRTPILPGSGTLVGRAAIEGRAIHVADAETDPFYDPKDEARVGSVRTMLGVPLLREGMPIGVIAMARDRVEPFADKEIALVQTFADQAVIAIENTRLLTELRESLEQQQAIAEVLQVINSSPGDLAPVFEAILQKAQSLCGSRHGTLFLRDGDYFRPAAMRGVPEPIAELLRGGLPAADAPLSLPLLAGDRFVHIADTAQIDHPLMRVPRDTGVRALLSVPLRKGDGTVIGMIVAARFEEPFSDKQIELLESFAAQAVIAMENARLLGELRTARDTAEKALVELKSTQASLIHAEKMASLGQLTAGIAHEIKNPLNFVNNFAGLSVELLDELKEIAAPGIAALDTDTRAEIDETIEMLTGNLDKISEHGRRADGIVQSMLLHSRGGSGERQRVDLNALLDEALNLAYHGARAQDQNFNITLERDFAAPLAPIELVPQDMTRVFLNLIGNGFHAAQQRCRIADDAGFTPILKVATCDVGDAVEVRVRDNGIGIAPEHRDKLFQPFFTTKPTGEGTGLGLSISYDIVAQQHGGTIEVESEPGVFTEFAVRLPRR